MLIFSGGTGTPKLIRGIQEVFEPNQVNIVANTADDIWMTNNLVCPDLDTIIYTLKGIIDDDDWWGIKNDTFKTHQFLVRNGFNEYMKIGDKDRAIHLKRTELLEQKNLTQATKQITKQLGIKENVFPMTNDEVNTIITTSDKDRHHFQDWWINHSEKEIEKIEFEGIKKASPSKEFIKTIEKEKTILIGPSNPITSIKPIIELKDIKRKLKDRRVIAISPFLGEKVFSGPAARLMKKTGYEPSSQGITEAYKDFLDKIMVDKKDPHPPTKSVKADIVMKDKQDEIKLARTIKKELV